MVANDCTGIAEDISEDSLYLSSLRTSVYAHVLLSISQHGQKRQLRVIRNDLTTRDNKSLGPWTDIYYEQ